MNGYQDKLFVLKSKTKKMRKERTTQARVDNLVQRLDYSRNNANNALMFGARLVPILTLQHFSSFLDVCCGMLRPIEAEQGGNAPTGKKSGVGASTPAGGKAGLSSVQ